MYFSNLFKYFSIVTGAQLSSVVELYCLPNPLSTAIKDNDYRCATLDNFIELCMYLISPYSPALLTSKTTEMVNTNTVEPCLTNRVKDFWVQFYTAWFTRSSNRRPFGFRYYRAKLHVYIKRYGSTSYM